MKCCPVFRDAKHELQRSSADASASSIELNSRIHQLEAEALRSKNCFQSQVAQLEEQVQVLEADKTAALAKVEILKSEINEAKKLANCKHESVAEAKQGILAQKGVRIISP